MKTSIRVFSASMPVLWGMLGLLSACGTPLLKRQVVDSSGDKPSWAKSSRDAWEEGEDVFYRGQQQIRGNERLSGCYDLARLSATQALLSEVRMQLRARLDAAQVSISEEAELALMKGLSGDAAGTLQGLRFLESYFERSRIGETERVDCQVLGRIRAADYQALRRSELNRVEKIDPNLREQMIQRHVDLFSGTPAPAPAQSQPAGG